MRIESSRAKSRLATTAVFFTNGLGIGAWASSIPQFRMKLHIGDGALSLALLGLALGATVAMPIAGRCVARFGSGVQTRIAAIAFAVSLAPAPRANALPQLVVCAFALGVANGFLDIAMNAHASEIERRGERAIMSSFHASFSIGAAAGAALAGVLALGFPSVAVLDVAAALSLVLALACWAPVGRGERAPAMPAFALPRGPAIALAIAALLGMLCEGATSDWSGVYLATVAHAARAVVPFGYGAFAVAMVAGRLLGDRFVRRFGAGLVVRAGAALACAGFIAMVLVPQTVCAVVALGCIGFGVANIVPVLYSRSGRLGASAASGITMTATAGYIGFLSGPPIVGAISTLADLRVSFALLAVFAGIVSALGIAPGRANGAATIPA